MADKKKKYVSEVLERIILLLRIGLYNDSLIRVNETVFKYVSAHLRNPKNIGKFSALYECIDQISIRKGQKYSEDEKKLQKGKIRLHSNLRRLCKDKIIRLTNQSKEDKKTVKTFEILEFPDGMKPTLFPPAEKMVIPEVQQAEGGSIGSVPQEIQMNDYIRSTPLEMQCENGNYVLSTHEMVIPPNACNNLKILAPSQHESSPLSNKLKQQTSPEIYYQPLTPLSPDCQYFPVQEPTKYGPLLIETAITESQIYDLPHTPQSTNDQYVPMLKQTIDSSLFSDSKIDNFAKEVLNLPEKEDKNFNILRYLTSN